MDTERIREIIELSKASRAAEIAVETPTGKVRVRRFARGVEALPPQPAGPAPEEAAALAAVPHEVRPEGTLLKAPYVGVFHRGARAGEPALVEVGQEVTAGQVLAVIETLNVPNEVTAPTAGWVGEFLVEEGTEVQYGEALMVLSPSQPEE
ncbi:MAG: acetyl-CoA carboxylase biotin carboxyl carrier protein [Armatimonadota bacterium]